MEPATAILRNASVRRKMLRVSWHKSHKTVGSKVKFCLEVLLHVISRMNQKWIAAFFEN